MLKSRLGIKDIIQADVKCKRVLMRVDYSVDMLNGEVADAHLVAVTIPTINKMFELGARCVVLLPHYKDPQGYSVCRFSVQPIVPVLSKLLNPRQVHFMSESFGDKTEKFCLNAEEGSVIVLENLRFHPEESVSRVNYFETMIPAKDSVDRFRASLSRLGDIYVNEAFRVSHLNHSSIVGISVPLRIAGLCFEKELKMFSHILEPTTRPVLAIFGGESMKRKAGMMNHLLEKVDMMIIGGALAYTFLKVARGMEIGESQFYKDSTADVLSIINKAKRNNVQLYFPKDFVCRGAELTPEIVVPVADGIPSGWRGIDIGPETIALFAIPISQAKAIIWYGTQGVRYLFRFSEGSFRMLDQVVEATKNGCVSVVAGNETSYLVRARGCEDLVSHISDGRDATRALLAGEELPGITALSTKKRRHSNTPDKNGYLTKRRK